MLGSEKAFEDIIKAINDKTSLPHSVSLAPESATTQFRNNSNTRRNSSLPLTVTRRVMEPFFSKNIRFEEIVVLTEAYGFRLARINGSHHIFVHPEVRELINLQKVNGMAKPYQIRQLLKLVELNSLRMGE